MYSLLDSDVHRLTSAFAGENDKLRVSSSANLASSGAAATLVAHAIALCEGAFPELVATDATYILSKDASGHQGPHTDAPAGRTNHNDDSDIVTLCRAHRRHLAAGLTPLSALVPLEDGASLIVWEGSHRIAWACDKSTSHLPPQKAVVIPIPLYSMVLFRQDLVHAGDGYVASNLRGHFFLDPRTGDVHRVRDVEGETTTHFMDDTFFIM